MTSIYFPLQCYSFQTRGQEHTTVPTTFGRTKLRLNDKTTCSE